MDRLAGDVKIIGKNSNCNGSCMKSSDEYKRPPLMQHLKVYGTIRHLKNQYWNLLIVLKMKFLELVSLLNINAKSLGKEHFSGTNPGSNFFF